ncbi:MAG: conjugal transfer protein TraT [Desulfovibrio sp.]|nr:conjugal transfer protein TraT [Desulfovibrio sp.]
MPVYRSFSFLLCLIFLLLPACVRQNSKAIDTEVLRHGHLVAPKGDVNIAPVVYINVRDNTNHRASTLHEKTEASLSNLGYTVVDNPSEAGHILQIVVLAAGETSLENARSVVANGYGALSSLTGSGGTAIVADVLLVQRQVPSSKHASRLKLKNISRRNAVANSQMRIVLLAHKEVNLEEGVTSYMMETLARELAISLHNANTETSQQKNHTIETGASP